MDEVVCIFYLLSEGYLYFDEGDISWDGSHHELKGVQVNPAKRDALEELVAKRTEYESVEELTEFFVAYIQELENDESLVVPRRHVSPALRDAIREGDLTGATLVNLASCGGAITVNQDAGDEYGIGYDAQLALGIPRFFDLVARSLWDLCQLFHSTEARPFLVCFTPCRDSSADPYIGDVRRPVAGAQHDPHDLLVEDEPRVDLGILSRSYSADRQDLLSSLRVLVASTGLACGRDRLPREMLDALGRAERGDPRVDLEELAWYMNDAVPESQKADLSIVPLGAGPRVTGDRFSIALPGGWAVVDGYQEPAIADGVNTSFAAIPKEAQGLGDLTQCDRILYSSMGELSDELSRSLREFGTDDYHWTLNWFANYGHSTAPTVWDAEAKAINTTCFISQHSNGFGPGGLEFDVWPYANDHLDHLRLMFSTEDDPEAARAFAEAVAQSVELDKPITPECVSIFERALEEPVTSYEFNDMVQGYLKPHLVMRQNMFDAGKAHYLSTTAVPNNDEAIIAGARGVFKLMEQATRTFESLMDAYEVQARIWDDNQPFREDMYAALQAFDQKAFVTPNSFGGAYDLISNSGVVNPTPELQEARWRLANLPR